MADLNQAALGECRRGKTTETKELKWMVRAQAGQMLVHLSLGPHCIVFI